MYKLFRASKLFLVLYKLFLLVILRTVRFFTAASLQYGGLLLQIILAYVIHVMTLACLLTFELLLILTTLVSALAMAS